jgi:hypothetical protein
VEVMAAAPVLEQSTSSLHDTAPRGYPEVHP